MFKAYYVICCFVVLLVSYAEAQTATMEKATPLQGMRGAPVNLPDISIIGIIDGKMSDDKADLDRNKIFIDEIETAFQGYIYPDIRADVFLAMHKHDEIYEPEICEAKVSFLNLLNSFSAEVGKIHINFGSLNKIHSHNRLMADQPAVLTNFFGDHGLVGQGTALSYLLPLPVFIQLEGGAWHIDKHHHHADEDNVETAEITDNSGNPITVAVYEEQECTEFSLADDVYTGRCRMSIAPTEKSEMEVGSSIAHGRGAHYEEHLDKATVVGADLRFRIWPSSYQRLTFQNEWLRLRREVPVGVLKRDGMYSFLDYRFNKYTSLGARFDYAEGALPINAIERDWSGIATYHLSETSAFMLQYKCRLIETQKINEGWLRLTFGIGPHSHELE